MQQADKARHTHIFFDVDSTLVTIEGIDVLGKKKGVGKKVTELTNLAMNGIVPMEQVFEEKITIVAPSKKELDELSQDYLSNITTDAELVVQILTDLKKNIFLVSGGFLEAILPLSKKLGIDKKNVFANQIFFDRFGNFDRLDTSNPLITTQGKKSIVSQAKKDGIAAFVGDGSTDLATTAVVKTFIGFGGVIKRTTIEKSAKYYVKEKSLTPILEYLLSPYEKKLAVKSYPQISHYLY